MNQFKINQKVYVWAKTDLPMLVEAIVKVIKIEGQNIVYYCENEEDGMRIVQEFDCYESIEQAVQCFNEATDHIKMIIKE